MKSLLRTLLLSSLLSGLFLAYVNLGYPTGKKTSTLLPEALGGSEEQIESDGRKYVQIEGRLYEYNERGIYNVNGVPTLYKKPPKVKPEAKTWTNSLQIDPEIYRSLIGPRDFADGLPESETESK